MILRNNAIERGWTILAVRAGKNPGYAAFKGSGADVAIGFRDSIHALFALFAKQNSRRLGMAAFNTVRGIQQFNKRVTHAPNWMRHANKLPDYKPEEQHDQNRSDSACNIAAEPWGKVLNLICDLVKTHLAENKARMDPDREPE